MIYALLRQDQDNDDCRAIAHAIADHDSQVIQQYIAQGVIIHVMGASTAAQLFCIYCRIPVFATDLRAPQGFQAQNEWHFEHRQEGYQPGQCIGHARHPPILQALGLKNPTNQGCYIQLGCETDANGNPTEWHRTRCKTIQQSRTYCHLAPTLQPPCIEGTRNVAHLSEITAEAGIVALEQAQGFVSDSRLEPIQLDYRDVVSRASTFRAGPESEEHRRLKEYVARSPHLFGLPGQFVGETEYHLPSGDTVDVLFGERDEWVAAEVKSKLSPEADIVRGIFQCIKYRAVIEAYQASRSLPEGARLVLVLECALPHHLVALKNMLGVEVLDRVEPR